MTIQEVTARSLLRIHKRVDSWFLSKAGMNLYRGCQHNCVYCDGRAETYQVKGEFGKDIEVKINALDLLERELRRPSINRQVRQGYLMLGGGVGDSYQTVEKTYQLTKKTLEFLKDKNIAIHILTKSTLVERDLELIKEIQMVSPVIVSMSFSSTNDEISRKFEPGVPLPSERLDVLSRFKKENIPIGIFLLPVIPFITDTIDIMKESIQQAKRIDVDFLLFGGMTLKEGRQKEYFYKILRSEYPSRIVDYENIYKKDKWGNAIPEYYQSINELFNLLVSQYGIPKRIPPRLFSDILSENDKVAVILEQMDHLLKSRGKRSSYGFASYSVSKLTEPISELKHSLQDIQGIGPVTEKIIKEILETGTSSYYEQLLKK